MHRIDGPGATVGNLFTEGNPSLSIPATTVTDSIMNDIQEEIVNVILDAGIILVKGTQTQLLDAVKLIIGLGGNPSKISIPNNSGPTDVTGVVLDKADFKGAQVDFEVYRKTDTQDVTESGTLFLSHNTKSDTWEISQTSAFDEAGVAFTITAAGQVQYTSDDLTGTTYTGDMRITGIRKFAL